MPRFFVQPSAIGSDTVTLTGDNAHHAAYSLRMAVGDRVTVCCDRVAYECELIAFDGETVTGRIQSSAPADTEPPYVAHLYQALPKGDKLDTVIQKAVECGVSSVTPFESSRCIVRCKPEAEVRKTERRTRIAEEAAKQCGRGIIPTVQPTVPFSSVMDSVAACDLVLFCYEGGDTRSLKSILTDNAARFSGMIAEGRAPEIAIIVGSEGGFSPDEAAEAATRGYAMTNLGRRILRTETAAGVVLSCLIYELEL
jgi:16S rRNA (uracil1498-N3)-methyltransferase